MNLLVHVASGLLAVGGIVLVHGAYVAGSWLAFASGLGLAGSGLAWEISTASGAAILSPTMDAERR